ncbi:hypothetical protein D5086_005796 [Populus alba]|uniref:Uncharacterized protein n=1 Tax=Populus alba TaxID=43335 RepID=A0ACC4CVM8_POPAL
MRCDPNAWAKDFVAPGLEGRIKGRLLVVPNLKPYLQLLEKQENGMKRHETWQVYGALLFVMCPCQSICGVEMRFRSSITDGPANVVPTKSSPLHMLREPIAPAPSGDSKRGPSTPSPAPAAEIENARVIVGISTRCLERKIKLNRTADSTRSLYLTRLHIRTRKFFYHSDATLFYQFHSLEAKF